MLVAGGHAIAMHSTYIVILLLFFPKLGKAKKSKKKIKKLRRDICIRCPILSFEQLERSFVSKAVYATSDEIEE